MTGPGEPAKPPTLAQLSEQERLAAMTRYALLRPHLEDGVTLADAARHGHVPLRTAQRWLAAYRSSGLAGLARARRRDRGRRTFPDRLVTLVEGMALQVPAPSVASIHRQLAAVAAEQDWPLPSYSTVYSIVAGLDPAMVTLAHEGTKGYQQVYDLIYRREAAAANQMWQADHTELDIWVVDPSGRPARPWLTAIEDDHSRAVCGYTLSLAAPSALNTALALHQAIWRKPDPGWQVCGIPEVLYVDHGADFTSRHLEQVATDLHLRLIFSGKGKPRGRGKVERLFNSVNQVCLQALPGYAPAGTAQRAERAQLTLPELDAAIGRFLTGDYHQRIHRETGQRPADRWAAGGFLPRMPDSLEALDLLLLTVAKARKIHPDGVHFQGLRYLDPTLAAYVGEPVTIRYDPRDLAEIRIFDNDRFLCRAICPELAGRTIALKDITAARNARRRELRHGIRDRNKIVEQLLAVHTDPRASVSQPDAPAAASPPGHRLKRYREE